MNALPATAVLFTMLTVAAISDIRERRVPNWLNATMLVVGLLAARPWSVTLDHPGVGIAGVTVGMAIWFPMYLLRLVGAGDVKLLAASGAWLGALGTLSASVWTAVAGGVLGVVWIVARQGTGGAVMAVAHAFRAPRLLQLRPLDRRERVPYAVAIAVGVVIAWMNANGPFPFLARG